MRKVLPILIVIILLLMLAPSGYAWQEPIPEDAPVSDCPDGYTPEHIWYEKDQSLWEWGRFWSGPTCVLKCVSWQCNQSSGLGGSRECSRIYMNSWGEDRPPWCTLGKRHRPSTMQRRRQLTTKSSQMRQIMPFSW